MTASAFYMLSAIASLFLTVTHSFFGFIVIMISASSIAMGSVGTSAEPIFETTSMTSGNFDFNICSVRVVVSMLCDREVPGVSVIWQTISPSKGW